MLIGSAFESSAPLERVWATLLDVERVAPCMPGATLTEVVDERTWKGRVTVKLGPVTLAYSGTVVLEERDDGAHRVVLGAKGTEARGKGTAVAQVTSTMDARPEGGTAVTIAMDLTITGAAAQYGRGMIADVTQRLTGEFARCLEQLLAEPGEPGQAGAQVPIAARPVGGIALGLWALARAVVRGLRRILAAARSAIARR